MAKFEKQILGNIDVVRPGMIEGWVCDLADPALSCTVSAYCDGKLLSEALADHFREDLQRNGIGNGRHGFRLAVPQRQLAGRTITLIESRSGLALTGSPIRFPELVRADAAQAEALLLIDLSDFMGYLEHHDHLSGIQRVQANIVDAIVEEVLFPLSRIRIVTYQDSEQCFFEIDLEFIVELIADTRRDISSRKFRRAADKRLHLDQVAPIKPLLMSDAQAERAQLLMLGAAWVFPGYFNAVRKLRYRGTRFVPLIHDLIPIVMPATCDKGTAEVFKIFLHRAIRCADAILTVSEHTLRDLNAYCDANGYRCPPASVAKNGQSLGTLVRRKEQLPIQGKFVLFVSTIEGRKNHRLAMQIWEQLIARFGDAVPQLVFIGRLGWRVESLVEELHEKNFLNHKITILSEVSDSMLAALYENCLFTLFPSFYEGWGLPVGESLAFNKVCLASNSSAIPEVGGELALYFDPNDLQDATGKAARLIHDEQWRAQLEQKIVDQFHPVSWAEAAGNILAGVLASSALPAPEPAPMLSVGEYNFARIPYVDSILMRGDEVARHYRDFARTKLTNKPLTLANYILAEESLAEGIWYAPENWGRWGHWDGSSLLFCVPDSARAYEVLLKMHLPASVLPATVEFSCCGKMVDLRMLTKVESLVRLKTGDFQIGERIHLHFRIKSPKPGDIAGDTRQLGVGLSRMALIEADSIAQRFEVLERLLFD